MRVSPTFSEKSAITVQSWYVWMVKNNKQLTYSYLVFSRLSRFFSFITFISHFFSFLIHWKVIRCNLYHVTFYITFIHPVFSRLSRLYLVYLVFFSFFPVYLVFLEKISSIAPKIISIVPRRLFLERGTRIFLEVYRCWFSRSILLSKVSCTLQSYQFL